MKPLLAAILLLLTALTTAAPLRLALLGEPPERLDALTAELSNQTELELMTHAEIEPVPREHALAEDLPQLNIWSGQNHKLHFRARESWLLLAEHGRRLDGKAAPGQVVVRLPPLVAGSMETAKLIVDGRAAARIVIWSPQILAGLDADLADANRAVAEALTRQGLTQSRRAGPANHAVCVVAAPAQTRPIGLNLLFTDRRDLPVTIDPKWSDVAFGQAARPGRLGVVYDDKEKLVHDHGNLVFVALSEKHPADNKVKSRLVILTPNFDFQDIDNIILLKSLIQEHQP